MNKMVVASSIWIIKKTFISILTYEIKNTTMFNYTRTMFI